MSITFRPHHFLCALCFQGKGYSSKFVARFTAIMAQLNADDDAIITVTAETDSICAPCPHKRGTSCTSQEKIIQLDRAHAEILSLTPGEQLTWGEAKQRIAKYMTLEKFHHACAPCGWKETGMCEKKLTQFISPPHKA